jgi:hypothetical protein
VKLKVSTTPLYEAFITLAPTPLSVGPSPDGNLAIYHVTGGTLEGPKIKGRFLPSGGDWVRVRSDGSLALDVRCCVETDDGALIYIIYGGRFVVPTELQPRVFDFEAEDRVDPKDYYFRIAPYFETSSPKYAWLNGICAVGVGQTVRGGVAYSVYAVD